MPELWAHAAQTDIVTTPCGYARDEHGRVIEPKAAITVSTAEGNLAFFGTAGELAALAERFAEAARSVDPDRPGTGTCALCDRVDETY